MRPVWPVECVQAEFCKESDLPTLDPNDKLYRMDNKTRFRVNEFAYFGCTEPEAVLENKQTNKRTDRSVFELKCGAGGAWETTFDKCVVEPVCDSIPDPEVPMEGHICCLYRVVHLVRK